MRLRCRFIRGRGATSARRLAAVGADHDARPSLAAPGAAQPPAELPARSQADRHREGRAKTTTASVRRSVRATTTRRNRHGTQAHRRAAAGGGGLARAGRLRADPGRACRIRSAARRERAFRIVGLTWIVERSFAWLGRNRRLSKDYEYRVQTSETLIDVAAIRLMLNRLAPA